MGPRSVIDDSIKEVIDLVKAKHTSLLDKASVTKK
jgi:hypothetical protein